MRVGLFLDFDGVLTPKPINMQIASMLGVEKELVDLEHQYRVGMITSAQFGDLLVPLFRKSGFSQSYMDANFSRIQLDPFAADIVQEFSDTIHIVTSSLNYYIQRFCVKYGIDQARLICSIYDFDELGNISKSTMPCGVREKETFVRRLRNNYDLTIGVGDNIEQDGPFLSLCDISVLMREERRDHLSMTELYSLLNLMRRIRKQGEAFVGRHFVPIDCRDGVQALLQKSPYERNVFIITPFRPDARYNICIEEIKSTLDRHGYFGYVATDHTLVGGRDLWANVRAYMHACRDAIALVTAHEEEDGNTVVVLDNVYNPNVMAEIGYMMGQSKNILVLKDSRVELPTDWMGKLHEEVDFKNPRIGVRAALERWIGDMTIKAS